MKYVKKWLMNLSFLFYLLVLFNIFFSSENKKDNKAKNFEAETEAKEN